MGTMPFVLPRKYEEVLSESERLSELAIASMTPEDLSLSSRYSLIMLAVQSGMEYETVRNMKETEFDNWCKLQKESRGISVS